ncbi:membrane protein [Arenimonas soli]|uniref:Membrane protein n=1 Tax=Arenimonas soli TaxID=2269504 RepID=A0ABQ1HPP8_9GAMM|nr:BatA domain-containing protein [Arenimonas soli]GGA83888.1 membrane protein [Arenimonas soli]
MSFGLAFPLGLLALLGLVLPLLVHLARREQQQPTMFAALRWLRAVRRPRQKLRLEQWLLLALRLLLVAGLALLLAAPWFLRDEGGGARVLVHPALAPPETEAGADVRWLAPAFPRIDTPAPEPRQPVASLLRQADAELATGRPLVVHVPVIIDGADGERPRLSRAVQWIVKASPSVTDAMPTAALPAVMVIRHAPDLAGQARWLAATQTAWFAAAQQTEAQPDIAPLDAPWPEDTKLLAWLAADEVPESLMAFANDGGTILLGDTTAWPLAAPAEAVWRGESGELLLGAARHGQGRLLQFAAPLDPATFPELLDARFPQWLQARLQAPPPAPTRVDAQAYAPLAGAAAYAPPNQPLAPWLAVVLAALFLVERWLAAGLAPRRPA